MKKHIAEDLPARSHPQASLSSKDNKPEQKSDGKGQSGEKNSSDKVRQAVYDIRYRARRENIPLRQAYSQYVQNSSMSEADKLEIRNRLFGKSGNMNEDYGIKELASSNVATALFKVFVEKENDKISEEYLNELRDNVNGASSRKYKVRVTDENGTSYVRYANREKISDLRANPNIKSVEMTEYGEPYEGERSKGEQTTKAKQGKKQNDGNLANNYPPYDKVTRGDVIAGAKGEDQMGGKKKIKEDFLNELNDDAKIDVMKKGKKNNIVVSPSDKVAESSYQKFMKILQEREMTKSEKSKEEKLKTKYDSSSMKANMIAQYGPEEGKNIYFASIRKQAMKEESSCNSSELQRDTRGDYAKKEVIKNKLRSGLGIKNPIVMISDEEEVKEGAGLSVGISKLVGGALSNPRTSAEQGAKNFQKNVADPVGKVVKGAVRSVLQPANMSPEAQKARRDKYRPEEVELGGEVIDERRKEDKVAKTPRKPRNPAFELVANSMGTGRMGVQPRGQTRLKRQASERTENPETKELERKRPASAGPTPAQKVANRRAAAQRAQDMMHSRYD